jgi:hypothetical protein
MEEFARAVEAFLALPQEEQVRWLDEAARRAKEISDEFDRKLRLDPLDLFRPMTM